jgi:hypothetical protein
VEEVGPPTVYLKDEKGKLVPVPGITYERFRELLLLEKRLGSDAPPTFALEKLSFQGKVLEQEVELAAELQVLTRQAGWTMLPLGMANALLRQPLGKQDGELVHRYDAKTGHTLWINAAENKRTIIQLPLVIPLKRLGLERQLALSLPRASEAELVLQIPYRIADFELTAGEGIAEKKFEKEATQVKIMAASGELAVAWKSAQDLASHAAHDLDVTSTILTRVETRDVISVDALLKLKRSSRNIDTFYVRYPPRFEPVLKNGDGFSMSLATAEDLTAMKAAAKKLGPGVIVRIDADRPAESLELSLTADYKPESTAKKQPIELSGFEVLDAGRQTGQISIAIPKGWLLKPTTDSAVFRLDDATTDPNNESRSTTKYRFVKQPFALKFDVQVQPTRTSVESVHLAHVEKKLVRLESTFHFRVRGPRSEFADFELGEWQLSAVGPSDLATLDAPVEAGKPTRLRLLPSAGNDFTVQLQLMKSLGEEPGPITFELPRALATQLLPAVLAVVPSESLAVLPLPEAMPALLAENRPPPTFMPLPEQASLYFREVPQTTEKLKFVAELQNQVGRINASLAGLVRFTNTHAELDQTLRLQIAHEPISSLTLDLPPNFDLANLRLLLGDRPLVGSVVYDEASSTENESIPRLKVPFPTPLLGNAELHLYYHIPLLQEDILNVPLFLPSPQAQLTVDQQTLRWQSESAQQAFSPQAQDARLGSSTQLERSGELTWRFATPQTRFVRQSSSATVPALLVDKAWLQIWLTETHRRDRFVAWFSSSQRELSLQLPSGVELANTRVLINNLPPASLHASNGYLHIGLPTTVEPTGLQRLEVWYLVPLDSTVSSWRTLQLSIPKLVGPSMPQQFFLQLLHAPTQSLVGTPAGFSPYQTWRKHRWWWNRNGALTTPQLEALFQAAPQPLDNLPTQDSLYVSLGSPEYVELTLTPTRWLFVVTAGSVLLGGWMIRVLSRGRHWVLLLTLATALLVLVLLMPETALALSRFLGIGLLLFLAVHWSFRFAYSPELLRPASRVVARNARTESRVKTPSAINLESTAAASLKELRP